MLQEGIVLGKREQLKYEVVCKYHAGQMTSQTACELLDISDRTLRRYVRKYEVKGLGFVRHGNTKRSPANKHAYEIKEAVQRLMKEVFFDCNMTHALQLMKERFQIEVPRETMRRWCHEIGLVKQKHKRRSKPRFRRERLGQRGLLVQFDGSHHEWYEGEKTCLIAGVDDATSEILWAEICPGETTIDCMNVLSKIVEKHGVFKALYVDRAGLYGGIKRSGFSQVQRALEELGTHVIYAQSPEGKGRIERLFRTLQDRLMPELRLNNIKSMSLANRYLKEIYIPDHNNRFSVRPSNIEPAFKALAEGLKIEDVFCQKEFRTMAKDHTLSLFGERWLVVDPLTISIADQRIEIRIKKDQPIEAYFAGRPLNLMKIKKAA